MCYSVFWTLRRVDSVAGGDTSCATKYAGGWALFVGGVGGAGGDALCAAPYAGGCRGWALFVGGAVGDAMCATLYSGGCGE